MKYKYLEHFPPALNDGRTIFVFGSNLSGIHGAGAAKQALQHWGASKGIGSGLSRQSYAIPTKASYRDDHGLPLPVIAKHIREFISVARFFGQTTFLVTPIGTGFANYSHAKIAPLFRSAPTNCIFIPAWKEFLECP
jgi:hypothetical protein